MEQAEWKIMPQAIDLIANGKVVEWKTITDKTMCRFRNANDRRQYSKTYI